MPGRGKRVGSRWLAISVGAACLAAGLLRPGWAHAQTVPTDITLSDTEFPAANWTAHVAADGGSTQVAQQSATGGFPGSWRFMIHTLFPNSTIYVWHIYTGPGGSYNPGQQGTIASLDFGQDRISISGKDVGAAVALTQNGRYYIARYLSFNNTNWQREDQHCLQAANFVASDGGPDGSPDFSSAGGPIQFGYARANPVPRLAADFIEHGIDNWSVTIHPQGALALPARSCLRRRRSPRRTIRRPPATPRSSPPS